MYTLIYYTKRKTRDEKAREDYLKRLKNSKALSNDIFMIDVIRKG